MAKTASIEQDSSYSSQRVFTKEVAVDSFEFEDKQVEARPNSETDSTHFSVHKNEDLAIVELPKEAPNSSKGNQKSNPKKTNAPPFVFIFLAILIAIPVIILLKTNRGPIKEKEKEKKRNPTPEQKAAKRLHWTIRMTILFHMTGWAMVGAILMLPFLMLFAIPVITGLTFGLIMAGIVILVFTLAYFLARRKAKRLAKENFNEDFFNANFIGLLLLLIVFSIPSLGAILPLLFIISGIWLIFARKKRKRQQTNTK